MSVMSTPVIEMRLPDFDALAERWLDGLPHGGVFVPGELELESGMEVELRLVVAKPRVSAVLTKATVSWRRISRYPPGRSSNSQTPVPLPPGAGLAFSSESAAHVGFLRARMRHQLDEQRQALRYPADERVALRVPQHALVFAHMVDVAPRGLGLRVPPRDAQLLDNPLLQVVIVPSHGDNAAAFPAEIAWRIEGDPIAVGVHLPLADADHRAKWARVFMRCEHAFDKRLIVVSDVPHVPGT